MFKRAVEYYRAINKPGRAEDSRSFRVAVLVTVLLSVCAAVLNSEVGIGIGLPVMLGVIVGSYYSYRTRERSNLVLKAVLTVLLLAVFVLFWSELSGSMQDMRYPLIRLFLWLQVLHSFNLPARRDLDFSLVSATILIAFAGSLSLSTSFLYLLVPFFFAGLVSLYLGQRSALEAGSDVFIKSKGRSAWRALALSFLAMLPITLVFFVALPRVPGFSGYYLPSSFLRQMPGTFEGFIRNPGYGGLPDRFPEKPLPFNPGYYHGFNRFLDLRVRGVPDDVTVMKVRSARPDYWRATAFDRFLGNGWENTEKKLEEISGTEVPLMVRYPDETPRYLTKELVQTFFIERKQPNTLFASFLPRDVYFPTRVLKVDSMGTVAVPLPLDPGLIYTVVSEVSNATPDELRGARGVVPQGLHERFCQLPEMSPEVAGLARSITDSRTNDYDRVAALSEYLKDNFKYDLGVPGQGNGENTVEFFLFREKRGYCEHFATSLAVMCRTLGIPARLAVGYSTGELNPLTGYYEVSARDAHSWVEVYFPVYGWISFDPTPGWSEPSAVAGQESTWSGFSLFNYLGRTLSRIFPAGWGRGLKGAFTSVGKGIAAAAKGVGSAVRNNWRGVVATLGLLALVLLLWLWLRKERRRASRAREGPAGPRERAVELFDRLAGLLAGAGFPRAVSQTPREYAEQVTLGPDGSLVKNAAELFNRARFAREEPEPGDLMALEEMVNRIELDLGSGLES